MADAMTPNPGPLWGVTGQSPGIEQAAGGMFVKGVSVHFTTASGLSGTVFVPDAAYNTPSAAETVAAMITAKATQMERIGKLSG